MELKPDERKTVELDFDIDGKVADYVTVPAGTYLCKIAEVQSGTTRNGDERWGFRLIVAEGEYVGRQAAWDGLVFSTRGMMRVRQVLAAFGLPTTGKVSLKPDDLVDRQAFVEVRPANFEHPETGIVIKRNEVPYSGYRSADPDGQSTPSNDAIPF